MSVSEEELPDYFCIHPYYWKLISEVIDEGNAMNEINMGNRIDSFGLDINDYMVFQKVIDYSNKHSTGVTSLDQVFNTFAFMEFVRRDSGYINESRFTQSLLKLDEFGLIKLGASSTAEFMELEDIIPEPFFRPTITFEFYYRNLPELFDLTEPTIDEHMSVVFNTDKYRSLFQRLFSIVNNQILPNIDEEITLKATGFVLGWPHTMYGVHFIMDLDSGDHLKLYQELKSLEEMEIILEGFTSSDWAKTEIKLTSKLLEEADELEPQISFELKDGVVYYNGNVYTTIHLQGGLVDEEYYHEQGTQFITQSTLRTMLQTDSPMTLDDVTDYVKTREREFGSEGLPVDILLGLAKDRGIQYATKYITKNAAKVNEIRASLIAEMRNRLAGQKAMAYITDVPINEIAEALDRCSFTRVSGCDKEIVGINNLLMTNPYRPVNVTVHRISNDLGQNFILFLPIGVENYVKESGAALRQHLRSEMLPINSVSIDLLSLTAQLPEEFFINEIPNMPQIIKEYSFEWYRERLDERLSAELPHW